MKILLHIATLAITLMLVVCGILSWLFGLELIEKQTFHYDGTVEGQITRAKPETDQTNLRPGLRYVFELNGRTVNGTHYRRNLIIMKGLSNAREIAAKLAPETKVTVYYRMNANGKVQSVLNPHPDRIAHLLYVGGLPVSFFAVTLYLVVVVFRIRKRSPN